MEIFAAALQGAKPEVDDENIKQHYIDGDSEYNTNDFILAEIGLVPSSPQDKKQLFFILNDVLEYPSSQLACLHRDADRVGNYDIDEEGLKQLQSSQHEIYNLNSHILCSCCGFRKQQDVLPTCISSKYIKSIGLPTLLYLSKIKHIAALILLSIVVYAGYAFVTNITSAGNLCTSGIDCSILMISLSSKRLSSSTPSSTQYLIQCWLGLANVVLIGGYFIFMTWRLRKLELQCEQQKSVSDFSIMVQYLPVQVTQQKFQQILNQYYSVTLQHIPVSQKRPFQIVTFNVAQPFYTNPKILKDKTLQKYKDLYNDNLDQFRKWIKDRIKTQKNEFSIPLEQRKRIYQQYNINKDNVIKKTDQLLTQVSKKYKLSQDQKITNTVFVTFRHQLAAHLIIRKNKNDYASRFRDFVKSVSTSQRLYHPQLEGARISKAPEPQDVIWSNVGVPDCVVYWKRAITYGVTFIILIVSFGITYGFSYLQQIRHEDQIISFVISLVIMIVNFILEYIIKILTIFEKNFTKTNYQTSFAVKVLVAQIINSVVFTFICNYIIRDSNIYETGGLSQDVFYLSLSGGFVTPLLKFFDFGYISKRLLLLWRDKPEQKLYMNQIALNNYYQGIKFDLASGYVYLLKIYIFMSFYISLQPIIAAIALCGLLVMYWGEKYVLLHRSTRPPNGSDILSNFMSQVLYFCPVFFALGSITWPIFLPNGNPRQALVPCLITIGVSFILFLIPLDTIFTVTIQQQSLDHIYQKERIYFTTQYERKNPATSTKGAQNYEKYLSDLKINASKDVLNQIAKRYAKSQIIQKGHKRRRHRGRHNPFIATGLIQSIFGAQLQDSNNPLALANAQADLAQKDTYAIFNNVLADHLKNVVIENNFASLFGNNTPMQNIDQQRSNLSNNSRKSIYPNKVHNPHEYFQLDETEKKKFKNKLKQVKKNKKYNKTISPEFELEESSQMPIRGQNQFAQREKKDQKQNEQK